MHCVYGNVEFDWDIFHKITNLTINGNSLTLKIKTALSNLSRNQGHPHSIYRRFFFNQQTEVDCKEIFDVIKTITQNDPRYNVLAAYLATELYGIFAEFWENELLKNGLYITGFSFWQELISITLNWESRNLPFKIHKGTPFFFLAYNCLLMSDRDNGFTYLYNAIEDDKRLPQLNYPQNSPAYLTATMSDKPRNYMYPLIRDMRLRLSNFLIIFNSSNSQGLTLSEFDRKFLLESDLSNTVYFFVYNFHFIFDYERNSNHLIRQNEFSRLRVLDLFFNVGLVIDQVLRYSATKHGTTSTYIIDSLRWWSNQHLGISQTQLDTILGSQGLQLNQSPPDVVIPTLLQYITNPPQGIPKELSTLLVFYKIRNHGGHNLNQQLVLTQQYDQIMQVLFDALFLAVRSI